MEEFYQDISEHASYETLQNATIALLDIGQVFCEESGEIGRQLHMPDVLNRVPEMLSECFDYLDEDQYENFAASPCKHGLSIGLSISARL